MNIGSYIGFKIYLNLARQFLFFNIHFLYFVNNLSKTYSDSIFNITLKKVVTCKPKEKKKNTLIIFGIVCGIIK